MKQDPEIQAVERKVFRSTVNDGLVEMRTGGILSMLAIAPLLSSSLGDFWSSVVWLPLYFAFDAMLRRIKRRVVKPRLGSVKFGPERKAKLVRMGWILLAANVLSLVAGLVVAMRFQGGSRTSPWAVSAMLASFLLVAFSAAGLMLQLNRFFLYGMAAAFAVFTGEWLFQKGMATHHGYPIVFGASSAALIGIGAWLFIRFLRSNPNLAEGEGHGGQ